MASVLVVDDHPDLREILEELLQSNGHTALGCSSAEEALDLLALELPDLVVADDQLPGMSGMGLLSEIRASQRLNVVPVIICSATDARRQQARDAGAIDFWLKGSDELFSRIQSLDAMLRSAGKSVV